MIDCTKEELNAVAHAINLAWEQGGIRSPQLAYHLLTGSEKIHQEWERLVAESNGAGEIITPADACAG
tara:strand:- start:3 stop:206 length:204 start_codon:yes stop_codon:yes gene_type:complete